MFKYKPDLLPPVEEGMSKGAAPGRVCGCSPMWRDGATAAAWAPILWRTTALHPACPQPPAEEHRSMVRKQLAACIEAGFSPLQYFDR